MLQTYTKSLVKIIPCPASTSVSHFVAGIREVVSNLSHEYYETEVIYGDFAGDGDRKEFQARIYGIPMTEQVPLQERRKRVEDEELARNLVNGLEELVEFICNEAHTKAIIDDKHHRIIPMEGVIDIVRRVRVTTNQVLDNQRQ